MRLLLSRLLFGPIGTRLGHIAVQRWLTDTSRPLFGPIGTRLGHIAVQRWLTDTSRPLFGPIGTRLANRRRLCWGLPAVLALMAGGCGGSEDGPRSSGDSGDSAGSENGAAGAEGVDGAGSPEPGTDSAEAAGAPERPGGEIVPAAEQWPEGLNPLASCRNATWLHRAAPGCSFAPRCAMAAEICSQQEPALRGPLGQPAAAALTEAAVACHHCAVDGRGSGGCH